MISTVFNNAINRADIWTDGGTKSNKRPFGIGYGSFRIGENGNIIPLVFSEMSANSAEILTMAKAIEACSSEKINLFSDSRVGLKWLKDAPHCLLEIPENISSEMKDSIIILRKACKGKNIKTYWKPRAQIFKIFNH